MLSWRGSYNLINNKKFMGGCIFWGIILYIAFSLLMPELMADVNNLIMILFWYIAGWVEGYFKLIGYN